MKGSLMIRMGSFSLLRTGHLKRYFVFFFFAQLACTIVNCLTLQFQVSFVQESLSQDSTAKYWSQRYSLKETIPGFLANIAATILTTGKYLNVMRECGHNVQVCLWITFFFYTINSVGDVGDDIG